MALAVCMPAVYCCNTLPMCQVDGAYTVPAIGYRFALPLDSIPTGFSTTIRDTSIRISYMYTQWIMQQLLYMQPFYLSFHFHLKRAHAFGASDWAKHVCFATLSTVHATCSRSQTVNAFCMLLPLAKNTTEHSFSLFKLFEYNVLSIIVTTAKPHSHVLRWKCAGVQISVVTLNFHCQCQKINIVWHFFAAAAAYFICSKSNVVLSSN